MKEAKLRRINKIPDFWLTCPPVGSVIPLPGQENMFFVPIKRPYPDSQQKFLPDNKKWTISSMITNLRNEIKSDKPKTFFYFDTEKIETETEEEILKANIVYVQFSPDRYKEADIVDFCNKVNQYVQNQSLLNFNVYFVVASRHGGNSSGFFICSYLMRFGKLSYNEALKRFAQSRPPGIYEREPLEVLAHLSPEEVKIQEPKLPKWMRDNKYIGDSAEIPFRVESTPSLDKYGIEMKDSNLINKLQDLVNEAIGTNFINSQSGIIPTYRVWNDSLIPEFSKNVYRISMIPRGTHVLVLSDDRRYIYIHCGFHRFWRVEYKVATDLPFVAVAYAVPMEDKLHLYLSDILRIEKRMFHNDDINNRADTLWFYLLPRLQPVSNSRVRLCYRPVGRLTDATTKLFDDTVDFYKMHKFDVEGLVLVQRRGNIGNFMYIPQRQTLLLFMRLASETDVFLYARTDDGKSLVAVSYMDISEHMKRGSMDNYVVRFEVNPNDGNLIPVSVCKNELPNTYSFVNGILDFYKNHKNAREIAKFWQDEAIKRMPPSK